MPSIKETVNKIETRFKNGYNNVVIPMEGVLDTEGQKDAVHFQTREQLKGAAKLIVILRQNRTLNKMLFGEEK